MHPITRIELFDVIASEKRHNLLMLPLKETFVEGKERGAVVEQRLEN